MVDSKILIKVIEYCKYHHKAEQESLPEDEKTVWDKDFVKVDDESQVVYKRSVPTISTKLRSARPRHAFYDAPWEIQTSRTRLQPHAGCLRKSTPLAQTTFFRAATGKAFTIVFAGFALTIISLPKTSLFPALVAGFRRVSIITTPGMVNLPFLTSLAATSARLSKTFLQSDFFTALLGG